MLLVLIGSNLVMVSFVPFLMPEELLFDNKHRQQPQKHAFLRQTTSIDYCRYLLCVVSKRLDIDGKTKKETIGIIEEIYVKRKVCSNHFNGYSAHNFHVI